MKKIYNKPEIIILSEAYSEHLMATSGVYGDNGIGYGGVDDGTHDPAAKKGFSRFVDDDESNGSFWDDND